MIPPALLIIGLGRVRVFGGRRRFFLPLPLFLIWPLYLLAYMIFGLAWLLTPRSAKPAGLTAALAALDAGRRLSGLRVDIQSAQNENIYLRFI